MPHDNKPLVDQKQESVKPFIWYSYALLTPLQLGWAPIRGGGWLKNLPKFLCVAAAGEGGVMTRLKK